MAGSSDVDGTPFADGEAQWPEPTDVQIDEGRLCAARRDLAYLRDRSGQADIDVIVHVDRGALGQLACAEIEAHDGLDIGGSEGLVEVVAERHVVTLATAPPIRQWSSRVQDPLDR